VPRHEVSEKNRGLNQTLPFRQIAHTWLVVSTYLKDISQLGNLPQIGMNIKKMKPSPRYHPWLGQVYLPIHENPKKYQPFSWIGKIYRSATMDGMGNVLLLFAWEIFDSHPFFCPSFESSNL